MVYEIETGRTENLSVHVEISSALIEQLKTVPVSHNSLVSLDHFPSKQKGVADV